MRGNSRQENVRDYRIGRTVRAMKDNNLDAIVATISENVRYITDCRPYLAPGYHVSTYVAILTQDGSPILQGPVTESAPIGVVREVRGWRGYPMVPVQLIAKRWAKMVATVLNDQGVTSGRIGIDDISFITMNELESQIEAEFVPAFDIMVEARAIKSQDEVALLRKAARIVDKGAEAGVEAIRPGVTEHEVVAKMAAAMYEAGSEGEPWTTTLSSGKRTLGSPYSTARHIKEGDLAFFDIGSSWRGYLGDISRTAGAGRVSRPAREVYTLAYNALMAGIEAVRPGAFASEVDREIRVRLVEPQCSISMISTGHGIGITGSDLPWITPAEEGVKDAELRPGMVLALEPRVGKHGLTAAGCEDMVLVTETGHEVLTKCTREEHLLVR